MTQTLRMLALVGLLTTFAIAGCGGGAGGRHTTAARQCQAKVGFEGPIGSPTGHEQLAFAQLAVTTDNSSHGTRISLVPADTRSDPARASTISDQFVPHQGIVAVVGPATNREVAAVGPTFGRAGIAFISASATGSDLTAGANPTFFRVVAPDDLQGPQSARFIVSRLHARTVTVVSDPAGWSRQFAASTIPVFRTARVLPDQITTGANTTLGSVASHISTATDVVVLAWQQPNAAQQLGRILAQQRKSATIVGSNRLYAPEAFRIPGSYVSALGPDIAALPADASIVDDVQKALPVFGPTGPPAYAATHVLDEAIASVCQAGRTPSRSDVLTALRATNDPTSILGIPIRFRPDGNLAAPRWFIFRIDSAGRYRMVP